MENRRLQYLLNKYQKGRLADTEKKELNDWFHALHLPGESMTDWLERSGGENALTEEMLTDFRARLEQNGDTYVRPLYWRIGTAAAVATILITAGFFFIHKPKPASHSIAYKEFKKAIKPGMSGAVLTLAGGKQVMLGNAPGGQVAMQGNTAISNNVAGSLIYQPTNSTTNSELQYNTLTTLRGHQMRITLADGTRVWLNASSSIIYPVVFARGERKVEIKGEAYFEVVHDASRPFRVIADRQIIEDVGTHFNVNTYADEPSSRTTLTEGLIKVDLHNELVNMQPGQQLRVQNNSSYAVQKVDTAIVLAWKNGLFKFRGASIEDVMRQISRWYNVTIRYKGQVSERRFTGEITRNVDLSEVLDILTYLHLQFDIEEKDGQTIITVIS